MTDRALLRPLSIAERIMFRVRLDISLGEFLKTSVTLLNSSRMACIGAPFDLRINRREIPIQASAITVPADIARRIAGRSPLKTLSGCGPTPLLQEKWIFYTGFLYSNAIFVKDRANLGESNSLQVFQSSSVAKSRKFGKTLSWDYESPALTAEL